MQSAHRSALLHRRVACELRICRLRAARGPAAASASSSALDGPTAAAAAAAAAGTTTLPARPTGTESSAPAAEEASAACLQMIEQLDAELALAAEREAALEMAPPSAADLQQMLCARLRERCARAPLRRLLAEITGAPQREWLALCHAASLTPASNAAAAAAEGGQGGLGVPPPAEAAAALPRRAMGEADLATEIARLLSQLQPAAATRGGGAIASRASPAPPYTHAAASSLDASPPPT